MLCNVLLTLNASVWDTSSCRGFCWQKNVQWTPPAPCVKWDLAARSLYDPYVPLCRARREQVPEGRFIDISVPADRQATKADRSPPAPAAKSLPPLAVAAGVVAAAYVARALFAKE